MCEVVLGRYLGLYIVRTREDASQNLFVDHIECESDDSRENCKQVGIRSTKITDQSSYKSRIRHSLSCFVELFIATCFPNNEYIDP